jgi:DnaB helicase-like protein/AAA domain-containing protein
MDAERPLPHNLDAERALLGAMLLDNAALSAFELVGADDFFLPEHRKIARTLLRMHAEEKDADLLTLREELERRGELASAGGAGYIAQLVDGIPRVSNVEYYARIVRQKAELRNIAHAANALSLAALDRDADPKELRARLRQFEEMLDAHTHTGLRAVSAAELLTIDVPPREMLLAPILPTQGLAMLHSKRGVGKTYLALSMGYAVSSGGKFLRWSACKPRSVLYVDGELPLAVLRERLAAVMAGAESSSSTLPASLRFITPDLQSTPLPDLATQEGQSLITSHLAGAELLILDNLSALCRSGKENEGESWLPVQEWALQLRRRGVSVLFIHHSGKGGAQRRTSRREDLLDAVISLRHPADYSPAEGLRCEVHFEKCRGFFAEDAKPFEVAMRSDPTSSAAAWVMRDIEDALALRAAGLYAEGLSVRDVAEDLGISKSKAHRLKRKMTTPVGVEG